MSEEYTPQPEPTQTVYITETAPPNLVKGAIGALIGSLLGGAIWGGIAIGNGLEVGYVAFGVGALAGIGASKFAGGKSAMLGVIAALFSIFGVLSGKYIFVAHDMLSFEEQFEEQVMQSNSLWVSVPESQRSLFLAKATTEFEKLHGAKPKDIGFFSVGPVTKMMFRPESEIFDGLDILFAIFALVGAWFYANEDSMVVES